MTALWPQYGPQSACHHALPMRVGAHAEPHAELEDARERAGRRQADHEALQDAELRIDLHDAHHAQDRGRGQEAVGVERDGEFVLAPQRLQKSQKLPALKPVLSVRRR